MMIIIIIVIIVAIKCRSSTIITVMFFHCHTTNIHSRHSHYYDDDDCYVLWQCSYILFPIIINYLWKISHIYIYNYVILKIFFNIRIKIYHICTYIHLGLKKKSLTWNKAIWGWFPLLSMISRSQWGRYNLPRFIYEIYPPVN
jgi:hypothetical protein